ncbi:hemerythrin domain-containing protein [Nocardia concava]|uniref:hemerythrin domain-containing protein n=1 Tax=Nocardia concava TaxID=257281 RepID=UPI00068518FD|nr:hemerythrin domain-containing protein [Nocardia concava]
MPRPNPHTDRAQALGQELIEVHNWLRTELSRLTTELDAYITGKTSRPANLRAHCTAFCQALTNHHTSEDNTAFAELGRQFPELTPVLTELREDHVLVANIIRKLNTLLTTLTPNNAPTVQHELSGLAAILESHFRWEERRIVEALNTLATPHPAESLFGLSNTKKS